MLEEVPMPWNWPVEVNNPGSRSVLCVEISKNRSSIRFAGTPASTPAE
jgi:hypothetical protein